MQRYTKQQENLREKPEEENPAQDTFIENEGIKKTGSGSVFMEENGKKGLKIFFSDFWGKLLLITYKVNPKSLRWGNFSYSGY